ncbi:hypothetical protein RIF29_25879 [Crotalaria pallida]|uniref:EF-hand domain-containing protein n=1 Tax=Crotalaria pallida TaxID=3830 RepID=A0AAN9I1D7_CROPI
MCFLDVAKVSKVRKQHDFKPFVKCSIKGGNPTSQKAVRVGVLGASGYTGAEVLRLLANHPQFGVALMTADRKAGQPIASVFPHLGTQDFRLRDISEYEEWYGQPHGAPDLQKEAIYGLTEVLREEIKNARLVANPGCYPTSIQLPLVPLIKANLIGIRNIIIDAKSGVSGAGRSGKENLLFSEVVEGINSYGVTRHRHVPETEQGLADAAQSKVTISFTPHLIPMVKNKGLKMKARVSGKKQCSSNLEYNDDEDEALKQAIALSLQESAEGSYSSYKNVVNIAEAEKKGNIHVQEDKGRKKSKKSFTSRLQMTEDELILHFFQFDAAGKGTVTARDLERAAIAHDFIWSDKELAHMMRFFDSDRDGKLSFDDFKKIVARCNMIEGSTNS